MGYSAPVTNISWDEAFLSRVIPNMVQWVYEGAWEPSFRKTQTCLWKTPGALLHTREPPKSASNLPSILQTLAAYGCKIQSLVDTIFGVSRKLETYYIFTIIYFPDVLNSSMSGNVVWSIP